MVKGVFKTNAVFSTRVNLEASIGLLGFKLKPPLPMMMDAKMTTMKNPVCCNANLLFLIPSVLSVNLVLLYNQLEISKKTSMKIVKNQKSRRKELICCLKSFPAPKIDNRSIVDLLLVYLKYSTSIKFKSNITELIT